jgi:hypothetical protein
MTLVDSFAGDYRRWSRTERIVSHVFLVAAFGGLASLVMPLIGG